MIRNALWFLQISISISINFAINNVIPFYVEQIGNETPDLIIMNAILDGSKLVDILDKNSSAMFENLSGEALAEQKEFLLGTLIGRAGRTDEGSRR